MNKKVLFSLVAIPVCTVLVAPAANATPNTGATAVRKVSVFAPWASLTVPKAGIKNLKIVRYRGTPDDGPGTVIQNKGIVSAPYGSWGGVLPGQVGNFFLAAHRTSAGGPMRRVPGLKKGDKIYVRFNNKTIVYTVAYRLTVNFRSNASKLKQLTPVPGFPSLTPVAPAIVLSTCATPEDDAAGLHWRDKYDNPTHRFNVVAFADPPPLPPIGNPTLDTPQ